MRLFPMENSQSRIIMLVKVRRSYTKWFKTILKVFRSHWNIVFRYQSIHLHWPNVPLSIGFVTSANDKYREILSGKLFAKHRHRSYFLRMDQHPNPVEVQLFQLYSNSERNPNNTFSISDKMVKLNLIQVCLCICVTVTVTYLCSWIA